MTAHDKIIETIVQKIKLSPQEEDFLPDLYQEARIAAVEAERSYNPDRGARLSTWVYKNVFRAVVDFTRKNLGGCRPFQFLADEEDETNQYSAEFMCGVVRVPYDRRLILEEAIERANLTDREDEAVAYYLAGYSTTEYANRCGFNRNNAWQSTTRAFKKIRRELTNE